MSQQQDTSATPGSQGAPAGGNNVIPFCAATAAAQAAPASPAPNTGGKKKRENPTKVWCDSAMRGVFGEFAAERGGFGVESAAPVVARILERYFGLGQSAGGSSSGLGGASNPE